VPHQEYDDDFGNAAMYAASMRSILKPPCCRSDGISRVKIQALEQPVMNRLQPQLPGLHSGIGGQPKSEEDEAAVWLQYARDPPNGLQHARDGA